MNTGDLHGLFYDRRADSPAAKVVRALSGHGAVSASQLARTTGLARSTVSTTLGELKRSSLVVEVETTTRQAASAGRPALAHSLNPGAGTCVGILLGLNEIRIILADVAHTVLAESLLPLESDYGPERAARAVRHAIDTLYKEHGLSYAGLLGAGFAVAGPLAPDGLIMRASMLPTWAGVDLRAVFAHVLEKPIFADNESNCAALAEMMWGAAAGAEDFVFFKLDAGVGGAVIVNGRVLSGTSGAAGEFGHVVLDPHGPLCRCGNRGCLEMYVSTLSLVREAQVRMGRTTKIEEVISLAAAGDVGLQRLLSDAGEAAGRSLAAVGSILNPPLFVIGGVLATAGDLVVAPLRAAYEKHALIKMSDVGQGKYPNFLRGRFLTNDNCMGAVGLVLRHSGRIA
ncbi:ROK family transcriptional regulator [Devosia sp. RR2S18]|uniref:ROK family transcriptional regulator n=1 Tax=Devosia rhizosphaerae TaxID=3049774 RepID=UPI0025402224|nr:ROK family transcriptional regulator [Devosia sp. RR2S18]WIJ27060.1 ROK family transcriptional regulator [Devosia sp. RR2S18]